MARKKTKKPKFKDELNQPIVRPDYSELLKSCSLQQFEDLGGRIEAGVRTFYREDSNFDLERAAERFVAEKTDDKLRLLAAHYGVQVTDADSWQTLLLALARDVVPGFTVLDEQPRGRGRPGHDPGAVYNAVLDKRCDGHSVSRACELLTKPGARFAGNSASALEGNYYETRRALAAWRKEPPKIALSHVSRKKPPA